MTGSMHPFLTGVLVAGGKDGSYALLFILPFLLVGLLILLAWRHERKRTGQLQQMAQNLGLAFFPKGDSSLLDRLGRFHLFSQGHSRKFKNMLCGMTDNVELAIFDYRYTTGSGKNRHTSSQSVVYVRSPRLRLPQFALRPEGLFHKIGAVFGYQDINFESHPQFSKMFLLRGEDEPAIRGIFDDQRLRFFEGRRKISVEGGGDQLVFYRHGKGIRPDKARRFMQEGLEIFALFCRPPEA